MGKYGEIWGILVQKYQRGEVIFFVPLKLGTRVEHEKLNFAIFEFYDFAKKIGEKSDSIFEILEDFFFSPISLKISKVVVQDK